MNALTVAAGPVLMPIEYIAAAGVFNCGSYLCPRGRGAHP
jgi:hypothetical protein